MKGRSHRLPITSDPHDDWVDGSWTVDCICGVNFDDGEEMVNCDECGVWVHTRCSRYVKSEKSFACDKCKNKNSCRNDSEETEVAQLLVELPTKTLRMENPYTSTVPSRRPFRLWTDIPMEERVHVQGVPGGDPALFAGLTSVFGPQLWKSMGYVPKKFNFRYLEFPCWEEDCWEEEDEDEVDKKSNNEDEHTADDGTGKLLGFPREGVSPSHKVNSVEVKGENEGRAETCDGLASPKQMKKLDYEDSDFLLPKSDSKKCERFPSPTQMKKLYSEDLDFVQLNNGMKKDDQLACPTKMKKFDYEDSDFVEPKNGVKKGDQSAVPTQMKKFNCGDADFTLLQNGVKKGDQSAVPTQMKKVNCEDADFTQLLNGVKKGDQSTVPTQMKKFNCEDADFTQLQNGVKKESNLPTAVVVYTGKRKKEGHGSSKDRSGKKRSKITETEGDLKMKAAYTSRTDRGPKDVKAEIQSSKSGNSRENMPSHKSSNGCHMLDNNVHDETGNIAPSERGTEVASFDASKCDSTTEATVSEENNATRSLTTENIGGTNDDMLLLEQHNSRAEPVKEEAVGDAIVVRNTQGSLTKNIASDLQKSQLTAEDMKSKGSEVQYDQNVTLPKGNDMTSSLDQIDKVKAEVDDDQPVLSIRYSLSTDSKLDGVRLLAQHGPEITPDCFSKNDKMHSAATRSLEMNDNKVQDVNKSTLASDIQKEKADDILGVTCKSSRDSTVSEASAARKMSSNHKHGPKPAEEPSRSGGVTSRLAILDQPRVLISVKKSSTLGGTVLSKSSVSDTRNHGHGLDHHINRKRGTSDSNLSSKEDNASAKMVRDEERLERPVKTGKDLPKSSLSSKSSQPNKVSHSSGSKRSFADSKDGVLHSSSKTSPLPNALTIQGSGESSSLLQSQSASDVENKAQSSALPHKSEKISQSGLQSSSKMNAALMHTSTSNPPATLSDEELALLLHQELNSSPRVPRVPRMRHAGSLPQLTSPTATSMLMKRTSSTGGKDNGWNSRRKPKDSTKECSRDCHDMDGEAKKLDRASSSPDHRRQDSQSTQDLLVMKREADSGSSKGVDLVKRNNPSAPIATASNCLTSSPEGNEDNMTSKHSSSLNASDDDNGAGGRAAYRTLPALIAEIMSKGKRMTYEELCNAVLPHWPNLRKHNGERYAYSSPSQAVLDCLRNRSEWARLVDRGPKTSISRKRRKFDADQQSVESEDNEDIKDRAAKDLGNKSFESHQEEFPKGKRKARKRRRLALQGRGIRDVRRRRRADVVSDDETSSNSNSTEDSIFSEDDMQGGGSSAVGNEASASSDENETSL